MDNSSNQRRNVMPITKVDGQDKGEIFIYALSTCIWCRKAKQFFDDNKIAYSFVYMDKLEGEEKDEMKKQHKDWNPSCSYPTIVINNGSCVVGFDEEAIRKELNL
jgi:glutaredoxin-like protein NrdH